MPEEGATQPVTVMRIPAALFCYWLGKGEADSTGED
jgi:hypothetical protein